MRVGEALLCRDTQRRAKLQCENAIQETRLWNGLDYVEYERRPEGNSALLAYLLCDVTEQEARDLAFQLQDADRRSNLDHQVAWLNARCVRITPASDLCKPRTYLVSITKPPTGQRIDPQFAVQQFTATEDEIEIDPRPAPRCPPRASAEPQINYLARDYGSLRQLLLDRLALLIPEWKERHVPDLGMMLVELLAYVGDYLSYYQDSVATEAYLNTARQRISVRRHARLVDYQLHEGCNARTFVHVRVLEGSSFGINPQDAFFITAHPDEQYRGQAVLPATSLDRALPGSYQAFEPRAVCEPSDRIRLSSNLNEIVFYTWNQHECCLPAGATRASLLDNPATTDAATGDVIDSCAFETQQPSRQPESAARAMRCFQPLEALPDEGWECSPSEVDPKDGWKLWQLAPGTILLFEEVRGPKTHLAADADPAHRCLVRLTKVKRCLDPVTGWRLVEIEWATEDALPFPLCISSIGPAALGCQHHDKISVARGNMVLVDHGLRIDEPEWLGEVHYRQPLAECDADDTFLPDVAEPRRRELLRPVLKEADLTFAASISIKQSVKRILDQKAHEAAPALWVYGFPIASEPADSFRPVDMPPPTLVTFADLESPLGLLSRYRTFDVEEQRRLEALLSPDAARYLNQVSRSAARTVLIELEKYESGRRPSSRVRNLASDAACGASDRAERASANPSEQSPAEQYETFARQLLAAVRWSVQPNLLDSRALDQHVIVEIDNERRCHLRFGDGQLGKRPQDQMSFYAVYRRGNGVAGNSGANKLEHLVYRREQLGGIVAVRNPRAAHGGVEPESLDHARLHAPRQFHKLRRAIIADDYAQIVRQDFPTRVQQARATLNWMGTWFEVAVAIDPLASEPDPAALVRTVEGHLQRHRRLGHLLRVSLPHYVGLNLALTVCVAAGYLRAHVRQELLDRFSNRRRSDGTNGFFHPDNFSFGDALYLSRVVQQARLTPGVENVVVTRFERHGLGNRGELDTGVIEFGPLEIPRLDNDSLRPERGCFCLDMRGER